MRRWANSSPGKILFLMFIIVQQRDEYYCYGYDIPYYRVAIIISHRLEKYTEMFSGALQ